MFTVPGWSVSTSELKAQTQQVANPPAHSSPHSDEQKRNQEHGDDVVESAQKEGGKRKRGKGNRDTNGVKVTGSNVDEMWRRHIEGQSSKAVGKNDIAENERKKRKKSGKDKPREEGVTPKRDAPGKTEENGESAFSVPATTDASAATKSHKKQKKKTQKHIQEENGPSASSDAATLSQNLPPPPPSTSSNLTPLQKSMRQKLISARFRHLNETLYTTPSNHAMELFTTNPELFEEYHAGFSQQVRESWPSNPVDGYVKTVKTRGAIKTNHKYHKSGSQPKEGEPLPRRPHGTCTIADLGCGDAQFAHALGPSLSRNSLNLKLLNYDLSSSGQLITKADISNLPLEDGSVDVAVFCLSLMGTNWVAFVEEAWRVLRGDGKGECWVSEVKSRFGRVERKPQRSAAQGSKEKGKKNKKRKNVDDVDDEADIREEIFAEDARSSANADNETDISAFVEVFRTRGFVLKPSSVDNSNKMFVKMEFVKQRSATPTKGKYASMSNNLSQVDRFGKKKFVEHDDESGLTLEAESKVLKPCIYKTR